MKAIKHIRAGLLHVEVIGTVQEYEPGRRRSGRCRPTSAAQQFYNDKCSWRELELILAANFGRGDWVATATYDEEHLPPDKREADRCFQKFVRKLRAGRRKRGQELRYVYVTEGWHGKAEYGYMGPPRESSVSGSRGERRSKGADGAFAAGGSGDARTLLRRDDGPLEDRRFHHHVVLNGCGPGDLEEIRSLWGGGGYVRIEPVDVHYYRELAKYLTKEAREFGRARPGEHAWHAGRNLKRYEVEYIEIPSDGVTLTPPPGAVDYIQFVERNPYGFADCVGARYLLFEAEGPPAYSYAKGRGKQKKNSPYHF